MIDRLVKHFVREFDRGEHYLKKADKVGALVERGEQLKTNATLMAKEAGKIYS